MSTIEFDYTIDGGAFGMHTARIVAKAERVFATETLISICSVHAPTLVHGAGDIRIEALSVRTREAIRSVAYSQHLRERMSGPREGTATEGAAV